MGLRSCGLLRTMDMREDGFQILTSLHLSTQPQSRTESGLISVRIVPHTHRALLFLHFPALLLQLRSTSQVHPCWSGLQFMSLRNQPPHWRYCCKILPLPWPWWLARKMDLCCRTYLNALPLYHQLSRCLLLHYGAMINVFYIQSYPSCGAWGWLHEGCLCVAWLFIRF